jgi:hypothetical protein
VLRLSDDNTAFNSNKEVPITLAAALNQSAFPMFSFNFKISLLTLFKAASKEFCLPAKAGAKVSSIT